MALTKVCDFQGTAFVQTEAGRVMRGTEKISVECYIKVLSVSGDKNEVTANVLLSSDEMRIERRFRVPVSVHDGSHNFIKQSYDYLKTLPEFSGATDC